MTKCPTCNGSGRVYTELPKTSANDPDTEPCKTCNGAFHNVYGKDLNYSRALFESTLSKLFGGEPVTSNERATVQRERLQAHLKDRVPVEFYMDAYGTPHWKED